GDALRVIGVYLAAIRAAQYALHDVPRYAVGGLGSNDGIIDRVERLRSSLESLRSGKPLTPADNEALDATTAYMDSYFRGLQSRDFLLYAQATGRTVVLWVRSDTVLVGKLKDWAADGLIKVKPIP